jgi:hypothetical protein
MDAFPAGHHAEWGLSLFAFIARRLSGFKKTRKLSAASHKDFFAPGKVALDRCSCAVLRLSRQAFDRSIERSARAARV